MRSVFMMLSLFFLALSFFGCSPSGEVMKKSLNINTGDSKQTVQMVMGDPGNRQLNGDFEAWQWCDPNPLSNYGNEYVIVIFNKCIVYHIGSYTDSKFKRVNWESPSDQTIEVRNR